MQEPVATDAEIHERGLDARFQIDNSPLIDVADIVVRTGPLDVKLFQQAVLHNGDAAFFRLGDVNQHFIFHES